MQALTNMLCSTGNTFEMDQVNELSPFKLDNFGVENCEDQEIVDEVK